MRTSFFINTEIAYLYIIVSHQIVQHIPPSYTLLNNKLIPVSIKDTSITRSLFKDHLLIVKNLQPHLHFTNYDYAIAGILFFSFMLFIWLYVSNRKRLKQVIKAFYISRYANQLAREEISLGNRVSIFLSILFILTSTIFIIQISEYYGFTIGANNIIIFLVITVVIVLLYGIKLLSIRLMGFIFQIQKEAGDYISAVFLFGNALGLFMLPVVICLAFVKQISPLIFIYTGFFMITVFLFTRLIRGLIIGLNSLRVSKFYLFLYLCTLEILPIVIMVKLFLLKIK
jgi:hypothetical protein